MKMKHGFISRRESKPQQSEGFTLVEMLVVISILSVAGILILTIFTRSLTGNNKSQIILSIKQNGQSVFDNLDRAIRDADNIVCPVVSGGQTSASSNTLVLQKNGIYTRYRFVSARGANSLANECFSPGDDIAKPTNGCLVEDNPDQASLSIADFINTICDTTSPMASPRVLTNVNPQTGVSFEQGSFIRNKQSGFKDIINITSTLKPGIASSEYTSGQIDPVQFTTSVQLR